MKGYKIVSSDNLREFEAKVEDAMKRGRVPIGGVSVTVIQGLTSLRAVYDQAMIKDQKYD